MGKSLKARFEEEGIKKDEIAHAIRLKGLLPVAEERECTFLALQHYAEKELGFQTPALVSADYNKSNRDLSVELASAFLDIVQRLKEENRLLREELEKRQDNERQRETVVKTQLLGLLAEVRIK